VCSSDLKSKTSLAEYFKWIGVFVGVVKGGFWFPIETAFDIKRGTLRKLAGGNANPLKPEKSNDFETIQEWILEYREDSLVLHERKALKEIRKLAVETNDADSDTIHAVLKKIQKIARIVDKKKE
jgi:hypothetical protein